MSCRQTTQTLCHVRSSRRRTSSSSCGTTPNFGCKLSGRHTKASDRVRLYLYDHCSYHENSGGLIEATATSLRASQRVQSNPTLCPARTCHHHSKLPLPGRRHQRQRWKPLGVCCTQPVVDSWHSTSISAVDAHCRMFLSQLWRHRCRHPSLVVLPCHFQHQRMMYTRRQTQHRLSGGHGRGHAPCPWPAPCLCPQVTPVNVCGMLHGARQQQAFEVDEQLDEVWHSTPAVRTACVASRLNSGPGAPARSGRFGRVFGWSRSTSNVSRFSVSGRM